MRLPASEKLEIIYLVEQSQARRTLEMLGIKPSTFYRWYDRFRSGGPETSHRSLTRSPNLRRCSVGADEGHRVAIGRCGDELFSGYTRYAFADETWNKLTRFPRPLRRAIFGQRRANDVYRSHELSFG
jgi:hypothetical protein